MQSSAIVGIKFRDGTGVFKVDRFPALVYYLLGKLVEKLFSGTWSSDF